MAKTDEAGKATLVLLVGTHVIQVAKAGYATQAKPVTGAADEVVPLPFRLAAVPSTFTVEVSVVDDLTGAPVAGADITTTAIVPPPP